MSELTLSEDFLASYKDKVVPWGPVGEVVYKRTYARLKEDGTKEDWWETTARCVNYLLAKGRGVFTLDNAMALFDHMFHIRGTVSGRAMWQMGASTTDDFADSLVNCWLVSVNTPEAFTFTFDQLMLGGGVGFNIQKETVYELPRIVEGAHIERQDTNDADFIVPDSREGWVELLRRTLEAHFKTGGRSSYSTVCVRPKGSAIKGFGGIASGPEDLCKGIAEIQEIMQSRAGKKLRPVDVLDIMNIIGMVVVSGNVRRSAEISIGDLDDHHFLVAKRFDLDSPVPNWRAMSNNSVACNDIDHLGSKFWNTYTVGGEPYGLVNLPLSRRRGRIADSNSWDKGVEGFNPCAEIPLHPWECCNLAEVHLPNIESKEQFAEVAGLLFMACKIITCLPYRYAETEKVVKKNRRTGISCTGILQAHLNDSEAYNHAAQHIEDLDYEISPQLSKAFGEDVPISIRRTTVKPAGTSSLLSGVSPGVHPEYAPYYMRRIRMASDDTLVEKCRQAGYPVEAVRRFDGSVDPSTSIISFPIKAREGAVAADLTALDQLEHIKMMQTYWADNAVSCTIYYTKDELPEIQAWLKANYKDYIKSVSFLERNEHGFAQAPLEEILKETYDKLIKKILPLDLTSEQSSEMIDGIECEGGACPVR